MLDFGRKVAQNVNDIMDSVKMFGSVRVLLVEDSPGDARLMREALRESELMVHMSVSKDGAEALEFLYAAKSEGAPLPDLILLDINLPKKNGHEVLRDVKSDPVLKKIPVLIMTSSVDENDISTAYNLNANCYIRKPSNLAEYDNIVRSIDDFWFMTVTLPESYKLPPVISSYISPQSLQ